MNKKKFRVLIMASVLSGMSLLLLFLLLDQTTVGAAINGKGPLAGGSPICDTLTDPMERDLCHFVTGIYPDGLLTDWRNPRLPDHFDHAPMRDYAEPRDQQALSESASMLALYAALIGDQTTFDFLFDMSAPVEIGGTGAPMSSTQESPYYFASPNLSLLHWILDKDGDKKGWDTGWLANAAGDENRWLEALSIADRKFPDLKYRLFANRLAWGLMGATDFNPGAIGNFEDPGTAEVFDDYLLRPYFGWTRAFTGFATTTAANLSYNNLMGWRYAAQLGQESHPLYQTSEGVGRTEIITTTDFYSKVLNYTAPLMAGSIQHCGTALPRVMYDIERHFYYGEILTPNLTCAMFVTATASSTQDQNPELSPINAADCITTTRWSSRWTDDEWIALKFSEPVTIDGVVLKWEAAYGITYTIDVSDDGVTWTPVYTETNGNGGDDEIHFPLTTTRHIRMHGRGRGQTPWGEKYGYSLWEFEVYRGGTSSLTALDLAQRAAAYARVSGDTALWEMGRRILNWYKVRYPVIAAAYDPCTDAPLPGWENGNWPSIMADLAELAAEYGDCDFARQVIEEKLRPKLITDPDDPLDGSVGASAFENLEVLLALRHADEQCYCVYLPIIAKDDEHSHKIKGVNYYEKDHAWDLFWPYWRDKTNRVTVAHELDIARALGVNTLRIFLRWSDFITVSNILTVPLEAKRDLDDFLELAAAKHMRVLPTLFDGMPISGTESLYVSPTIGIKHLDLLLEPFENDGGRVDFSKDCRILAWDIKNEPDRDYYQDANGDGKWGRDLEYTLPDDVATVQSWADKMIEHLRAKDSYHPITVGVYGAVISGTTLVYSPTIVGYYANVITHPVDFLSVHYSLDEKNFPADIDAVEALAGSKPIVVEEFALHTWVDPLTDTHKLRDQAAYYNAILSTAEADHLAGSMFWTLTDFFHIMEGDDERLKHVGILHNASVTTTEALTPTDYSEKPAAAVVREHFKPFVAYLDTFDGYALFTNDNCNPPLGWTDNRAENGAVIMTCDPATHDFAPSQIGRARLTKLGGPDGISTSPILEAVNVNPSTWLVVEVLTYTVRDTDNNTGPINLDIGVKATDEVTPTWLISDLVDSSVNPTTGLKLPQTVYAALPSGWQSKDFQIIFRLQDHIPGKTGYSAGFELEFVRIGPLQPIISDVTVTNVTTTTATVTWTTDVPADSTVTWRGAHCIFDRFAPADEYVQAIVYAPGEYRDRNPAITPWELKARITKDLEDLRACNFNTVVLYPLLNELDRHIFAEAERLGLKVVFRLEEYKTIPHCPSYRFDWEPADVDCIIDLYRNVSEDPNRINYFAYFQAHPNVLLFYLINLPLDDTTIPTPTKSQLRQYVAYFYQKAKALDSNHAVYANTYYGGADNLPQASVADLVDGVTLTVYATRESWVPYDCGTIPVFTDPDYKIVCKDQYDYFIDKAFTENRLAALSKPLVIDQTGFAYEYQNSGQTNGRVADKLTKFKAINILARLLKEKPQLAGWTYFEWLDKVTEANWGLLDEGSLVDPTQVITHTVVLTDLTPGTVYSLTTGSDSSISSGHVFTTTTLPSTENHPRITITAPPYGNVLAVGNYTITWVDADPDSNAAITLFYDRDDRGADGTMIAGGISEDDETDVFTWTLPSTLTGAIFVYARIDDGENPPEYDYSSGMLVTSLEYLQVARTCGPIAIDGTLSEPTWSDAQPLIFAVHPPVNGSTTAIAKALWDDEFLYIGFDVADTQVETAAFDDWNDDSVSISINTGINNETLRCRQDIGGTGEGNCERALQLRPGTTLNTPGDTDVGFTVEMKVSWSQVRVIPSAGDIVPADLLSVDHDGNPGGAWNDPLTRFSKISWDGDSRVDTTGRSLLNVAMVVPPVAIYLPLIVQGKPLLNWTTDLAHFHYDVHRASVPYFTPSAMTVITSGLPAGTGSYTDLTAHVGDSTVNDFYVIRAFGCDSQSTVDSNRVGYMDFQLVPGN